MFENAIRNISDQTSLLLAGFTEHDRVQVAPHLDCWMAGDRYGEVTQKGRFYLHVRMYRSGKVRKVAPENALLVA